MGTAHGAAQIELSSLLLLSRVTSGFFDVVSVAWPAGLAGRRVGSGLGSGLSEEPVYGVQSGRAGVGVVPWLPSRALLLLAAAPGLVVLALLMIPLGLRLSPWLGSLSASVQRAVPSASSTEAFATAPHGASLMCDRP